MLHAKKEFSKIGTCTYACKGVPEKGEWRVMHGDIIFSFDRHKWEKNGRKKGKKKIKLLHLPWEPFSVSHVGPSKGG